MKSLIVAGAGLFLAALLLAQEEPLLLAQPVTSQDQVPGLLQTPDGQIIITAGENLDSTQETLAEPAMSTSTGPTFPVALPAE